MHRLTATSKGPFRRRWRFRLVLIPVVLVALISSVAIMSPRIIAVYQLYWGHESIKALFHDELGFSDAVSESIAVVFAFFYALSWVPLLAWLFRAMFWRYDWKQQTAAFIAWVTIYGHAPLARALLGGQVCFNQSTGKAIKWYVLRRDGQIEWFDSSGYDPALGDEKKPVTAKICQIIANYQRGKFPTPIRASINTNPPKKLLGDRGEPIIWYHQQPDGFIQMFDAPGFYPGTTELLLPLTDVEEVRSQEREASERFVEKRERERLPEVYESCARVPKNVARLIVIPASVIGAASPPPASLMQFEGPYDLGSTKVGTLQAMSFGVDKVGNKIKVTMPTFTWNTRPSPAFSSYTTVGMSVFDIPANELASFKLEFSDSILENGQIVHSNMLSLPLRKRPVPGKCLMVSFVKSQ
ncbi:MAG: hypothetical protein ACLPID_04895 [Beijerinckiaceae bacterium]